MQSEFQQKNYPLTITLIHLDERAKKEKGRRVNIP
jgi:hypothetical protein